MEPVAPAPAAEPEPITAPGQVININAVELPAWALSIARTLAREVKAAGRYQVSVIAPERGEPAWELAREEVIRRGR